MSYEACFENCVLERMFQKTCFGHTLKKTWSYFYNVNIDCSNLNILNILNEKKEKYRHI